MEWAHPINRAMCRTQFSIPALIERPNPHFPVMLLFRLPWRGERTRGVKKRAVKPTNAINILIGQSSTRNQPGQPFLAPTKFMQESSQGARLLFICRFGQASSAQASSSRLTLRQIQSWNHCIVVESVVRISGCLVIKRGEMSNLETVR